MVSKFGYRLATSLVLLLGAASTGAARTQPTETMNAYGVVVKIIDASTVMVDRGTLHGLTKDRSDLIVRPVRYSADKNQQEVRFNLRSARARVIQANASTATLGLSVIAEKVKVGDAVWFPIAGGPERELNSLFRAAANHVVLLDLTRKRDLMSYTRSEAATTLAEQEKIYEELAAEIRKAAPKATMFFKNKRPKRGRYKGLAMNDVLARTTAADVRSYFDYQNAYMGSYLARRWTLHDVYGTWVLNGMSDDGGYLRRIELGAVIRRADGLSRNGRLGAAEKAYRMVLAQLPTDAWSRKRLGMLEKAAVLKRRLQRDPDGSGVRFRLVKVLFDLGAYDACLPHLDVLDKQRYQPKVVGFRRAKIAVRQKRFKDALAYFDTRLQAKKPSAAIRSWRSYAAARYALTKDPKDFEALMTLAKINVDDKAYTNARDHFYSAMDAASTPDQLEQAKRGVRLISQLREMDKLKGWALENIDQHSIRKATKRIKRVLQLASLTGQSAKRNALLKEFANRARGVKERTLAMNLLRQRTSEFPEDPRAWYSLAWTAYAFGDVETAEWAAGRSLAVKPGFVDGNHLKSLVAARLGDYDRAVTFSKRSSRDSKYGWPRLLKARVAVARGDMEAAVREIQRAAQLLPDAHEVGKAKDAITRLQQAHETLRAPKPKKADQQRARLSIVRALARLDLAREALVAMQALKTRSKLHREAAWSIVANTSLPLRQRIEAAVGVSFKKTHRRQVLAQAKAASAVTLNATRERRMALARAEIELGNFHEALAALGFLIDKRTDHPAQALVGQARTGLQARALLSRASKASNRSNFAHAAKLAAKASGIYAEIGYTQGSLDARFRWADALSNVPDRPAAMKVVVDGLKKAVALGHPNTLIDLRRIHAFIEAATGKLDATAKALLNAQNICASEENTYCLAMITRELGELASEEGRLDDALAFTRESIRWAKQRGERQLENDAQANLAQLYMRRGELKSAHDRAKALLRRARRQVDFGNERFALMVLGSVAMKRSQSERAHGYFNEAYQVGAQMGNPRHRAAARRATAAVHLNVDKDFEKASQRYAEAARLYKSAKEPLEAAEAQMGLAQALTRLGRFVDARAAYNSALTTARKMDRRPMLARLLSSTALLAVDEKREKQAMKSAREALKVAEQLQVSQTLWTSYYALGRAQKLRGDSVQALESFEKAIKLSSELASKAGSKDDQAGFLSFGTTGELYEQTIALLLRMRKVNRAMEILELSRSQKLRRIFDPARLKSNNKKVQASLLRLRNANQRVAAAEEQLKAELSKSAADRNARRLEKLTELVASSNAEVRQLLLRLKKDHRNLYNAISIKPGQLVRRRSQIPEGAAIVQYFMSDTMLYAFIVSRDTAQAKAVQVAVDAKMLNQAVSDFRRQLLDDQDELVKISRKLNKWLLEPLKPHLANAETLLIVPFGMLYYLPFQALVTNEEGPPTFAIEQYRIAYLSSTTMDRVLSDRQPRPKPNLLAFANPDGTLPGARAETELIKSAAFPKARIYFEKKATKKSFFDNAGKYRIIHFATHGVLDEDPLASYLVMAQQRLTVDEIAGFAGLEETTDLVVLSACSTAVELGKSTGDEVISIAEAFATAGAPALVASLWDVDDGATKELMATFYRTLQNDPETDLLEALRRAQIKLKRTRRDGEMPYAAPVYWAAFGLVGDYR